MISYRSHISLSYCCSSSSSSLCATRKSKIHKFALPVLGEWERDAGLEMERRRSSDESTSHEKTSRWLKTFYIPLWPLTFRAAPEHRSLSRERASESPARFPCSIDFKGVLSTSASIRPSRPCRFSPTRACPTCSRVYLASARLFVERLTFATGRSFHFIPMLSSPIRMTSVLFHDFLHVREVSGKCRQTFRKIVTTAHLI